MQVFPGSPQQLQLVRTVQQGVDALLSVIRLCASQMNKRRMEVTGAEWKLTLYRCGYIALYTQ